MEEVGSTRLTSLEHVTTGVGSVSRAARWEADSHGRLLRRKLPDDVVSTVITKIDTLLTRCKFYIQNVGNWPKMGTTLSPNQVQMPLRVRTARSNGYSDNFLLFFPNPFGILDTEGIIIIIIIIIHQCHKICPMLNWGFKAETWGAIAPLLQPRTATGIEGWMRHCLTAVLRADGVSSRSHAAMRVSKRKADILNWNLSRSLGRWMQNIAIWFSGEFSTSTGVYLIELTFVKQSTFWCYSS